MRIFYMPIIFPIAITLHNIEEALWLPEWSLQAKRYHKPVVKKEFQFALLCVTILAYITSFLFLLYGDIAFIRYIFFGFVGCMIFNVIFPHLVATVFMKKYAPGILTGLLINLPFFSIIIVEAIRIGLITVLEFVFSTVLTGICILIILPMLFKIGEKLLEFED